MFLLFSMIKNSLIKRVLFLFFKYLSNLSLLLVYSGGNLDSLKNLHRLAYHWSTCRQWFFLSTGCMHFAVDYFWFYSISAISITLLLYNNGPDFPGSNNRALFSLLAWHWLTIRRDFPIDIRDKHRGFPQRDITLQETNQANVNLSNHFSVLI